MYDALVSSNHPADGLRICGFLLNIADPTENDRPALTFHGLPAAASGVVSAVVVACGAATVSSPEAALSAGCAASGVFVSIGAAAGAGGGSAAFGSSAGFGCSAGVGSAAGVSAGFGSSAGF